MSPTPPISKAKVVTRSVARSDSGGSLAAGQLVTTANVSTTNVNINKSKKSVTDSRAATGQLGTTANATPNVNININKSTKSVTDARDVVDSAGADATFTAVHKSLVMCLSDDSITALIVDKLSEKISANILASFREQISVLKDEVHSLRDQLHQQQRKFDHKLDEAEQYNRRMNLRVFGVPECDLKNTGDLENTDDLVIKVFKKLNVQVSLNDIQRSHRVGRRPDSDNLDSARHRPIIVKFVSYRLRAEIFRNKKLLKGQRESICEDLTSRRLTTLKNLKTKYGAKNVWTFDGNIHYVNEEGTRSTYRFGAT